VGVIPAVGRRQQALSVGQRQIIGRHPVHVLRRSLEDQYGVGESARKVGALARLGA
jgi:hypothetical protein